jgi:hypothetical protein
VQYHPEDFQALSTAVAAEGGHLLLPPCEGVSVRLKQPYGDHHKWVRYQTTHCNMSARMAIPYDPRKPVNIVEADPAYEDAITVVKHPGEKPADGHNFATVCAVDDAVGLWPRYAGVVSKRSYQKA